MPTRSVLTVRPAASSRAATAAAPSRTVVEDVRPRVDDGRYAAKAVVGDPVQVEADAFADGHDLLRCELQWRPAGSRSWKRRLMAPLGNDRWRAIFVPTELGRYQFQVRAQIDPLATWLHDLRARVDAGQDVAVELVVGADLMNAAAEQVRGAARQHLTELADRVRRPGFDPAELFTAAATALLAGLPSPEPSTTSDPYEVYADRPRARFSSWYELFPRSTATRLGRHGTFRDVVRRLDYVARLGFDVLYLPPIHPIGTTNRKGRNGAVTADPTDVGSPWAIGGTAGGHTAVHPDLGTLADFDAVVAAAGKRGIEVALDLAYQCSPDHPWVREHPQWFKHRPDGSIRYAENPPKRYEDVYPLDFDTADWRALWDALREVVEFWIDHGVRIFRVDNPHTKAFAFWEWLIPTIQAEHPDVLFLAEAFTRPKVMYRLAKIGFTQSYTYFTWRTAKWELEQYLTELTNRPVADFFRPNFWPNTPDILTEQLQHGGAATFRVRALLAATLTANYGVYGPVFELGEHRPRHAGSEEYLDGEKYEVRRFKLDAADSLAPLLERLNRIRRDHAALQHDRTLTFHRIDNDQLIAYSKSVPAGVEDIGTADGAPVLVVVNLDPAYQQSGWVELDLAALGVDGERGYVVHDLLNGGCYRWEGSRNFVMLDPEVTPGHVFQVQPASDGAGA
ncbi:MAG TPA: alpha-1,4-glucan--maltose-1-phosphate maltosyltransferase [Mycobacteriales bacterium]|nr:alpha-1,4-glucan--maltose-1-phosphate maltosyltransferase [Mycobacteriales bacterium]